MRTKEITIKIKPKLRWIKYKPFEKNYYAMDGKIATIYEIIFNKNLKEWSLNFKGFSNLGYFKSLKTAKAVAELLYQG